MQAARTGPFCTRKCHHFYAKSEDFFSSEGSARGANFNGTVSFRIMWVTLAVAPSRWLTRSRNGKVSYDRRPPLSMPATRTVVICSYKQRVRALHKRLPVRPDVVYVDAAEYRHHNACVIAAINDHDIPRLGSLNVNTIHPATEEKAAIALALSVRQTPSITISDSKTAIQNFASGLLSRLAFEIVQQNPPNYPVELI